MTQPTLKPCPFCDGEPTKTRTVDGYQELYGVRCSKCDTAFQKSPEAATALWNRALRPEDARQRYLDWLRNIPNDEELRSATEALSREDIQRAIYWLESSAEYMTSGARVINAEPFMRCSFCCTSQKDAKIIIAGTGVFICGDCVRLCGDIVAEQEKQEATS